MKGARNKFIYHMQVYAGGITQLFLTSKLTVLHGDHDNDVAASPHGSLVPRLLPL